MVKHLLKLDQAINKLVRGLMALGLFTVLVGLILQMLSRYVLGSAIFGIEEVVIIAAFWTFFLGLSYGARTRNLISGELVTSFTSNQRALASIAALANILSLVCAAIFCLWAWEMVAWTYSSGGRTPVFGLSLLVYQLPVLIGFAMCAIYFTAQTVAPYFNTPRTVTTERQS